MIQNYELYYIINPVLEGDKTEQIIEKVNTYITDKLSGTDIKTEKEGLKKLAYKIDKHATGYYILVNFDVELANAKNINSLDKFLNLEEGVIRFVVLNRTDFNKQQAKQEVVEIDSKNHRQFNKGRKSKACLSSRLGLRVIDYRDVDYLDQFTSPYAKIFVRSRTGNSAKFQRKIDKAIKLSRHMALMPFTPQYE